MNESIYTFEANDINKYIDQNRKWNEKLNKLLEIASSSIKSIIISEENINTKINANDIILKLFAIFDQLKYLNATNECNYMLSNLLCADLININYNSINIINNNLQTVLILSLQLENNENIIIIENDKNKNNIIIILPKTLEFIQIMDLIVVDAII